MLTGHMHAHSILYTVYTVRFMFSKDREFLGVLHIKAHTMTADYLIVTDFQLVCMSVPVVLIMDGVRLYLFYMQFSLVLFILPPATRYINVISFILYTYGINWVWSLWVYWRIMCECLFFCLFSLLFRIEKSVHRICWFVFSAWECFFHSFCVHVCAQ